MKDKKKAKNKSINFSLSEEEYDMIQSHSKIYDPSISETN